MILAHTLHTLVLAQAAAPAAPGRGGPMDGLITIGGPLLMFAVIYLLLIRPAGKQRKEHQNMLSALKKDDEIVTTGGLVGRIVALEDRVATVEIADRVKVRVMRDRIAGRYTTPTAQATAATAQKKS